MGIGQQLLNVPMGDMIRQMAFAIADAQLALDESSVRVAELMGGTRILRDPAGNLVDKQGAIITSPATAPIDSYTVDTRVFFDYDIDAAGRRTPAKVSMLELGFTPTFYQFIDTVIEVKIAITVTQNTEFTRKTQGEIKTTTTRSVLFFSESQVTSTPVDATYSSKYSYSAEGSSLLRTKLVPVPPPPILEERIRNIMERDKAERAAATAPTTR